MCELCNPSLYMLDLLLLLCSRGQELLFLRMLCNHNVYMFRKHPNQFLYMLELLLREILYRGQGLLLLRLLYDHNHVQQLEANRNADV